ncbi:ABC transporter permease [Actinomadura sp. NPDC048955]|uniref:ABC transporter permease n=1 Tax=Actinomadura sp. NPDC048955 TaxID=3158228 RepID=UPI003408EF89
MAMTQALTRAVDRARTGGGHRAGTSGRRRGGAGGGWRGAVAAEWTKLWSLRSTWWGLAAAVALMAAMAFTLATSTVSNNTNAVPGDDMGVVSASGAAVGALDMVQFVVLAVAILMITGEYATGGIRATLQCVPPRGRMLGAKAVVVAAVTFPLGVALNAAGTAVADPVLGRWGRLGAGEFAADALQSGAYLALAGVLVLGIGAVLRSTAASLTAVFLFLMVVPMLLGGGDESGLARKVSDSMPSSAGRYFMSGDGPYPQAAGLAILVAWTAAAVFGAVVVLRRRDA